MRRFRRHPFMWSLSLLGGVAVVGFTYWPGAPIAALLSWNGPWVAQVRTETPLDAVDSAVLQQVRDAGALDVAGLAPLNLNEAQATTCLTDLRTWFDANRANATSALQSLADAAAQLRNAASDFAAGAGDAGMVDAARTALATAQAAMDLVVQDARAAAWRTLDPEARVVADRVHANRGADWRLPYDVVAFGEGEDTALRQALRRKRQRTALRSDREAAALHIQHFEQERAAALGVDGTQTLDALASYLAASSTAALAADQAVFPPPDAGSPS